MKQFIKKAIAETPLIRELYYIIQKPLYDRRFATTGYGGFRGVFNTFEEAIEAAPKTKNIGYDNPELAKEYVEMMETGNWEGSQSLVRPPDYPVMFWLSTLLNVQHVTPNIFDFGGNVGFHYYAYSKYIQYPDPLKWTVCELPAIEEAGRKLAERLSVSNLFFLSDLTAASGCEIFLASGSLQYLKDFSNFLSQLTQKPKHLLINRLPLYDGEQFVTLQNGGKVFYPQYVFNRRHFIEALVNSGYQLIDLWEDHQDSCIIPFHPDRAVRYYHGLYLRLKS